MNSQALVNTVQILTGIAVLIGLGLVVWELQQTKDLTRLQTISDTFALNVSYNASFLGENPNPVITKACVSPNSLTVEDAMLLEFYFVSLEQRVLRLVYMRDLSEEIAYRNLGLTDVEMEQSRVFFELFFTVPGQRWYEDMRQRLGPSIREVGDRILEQRQKDPSCVELLQKRLERFKG